MSTRAQIVVEGQPLKVYIHCDGYPDGVLPTLEPFVRDFLTARGWDPSYMLARMCQAMGNTIPGYLSLGIDDSWHSDIEFAYVVRRTGVATYAVVSDHGRPNDVHLDQRGKHAALGMRVERVGG